MRAVETCASFSDDTALKNVANHHETPFVFGLFSDASFALHVLDEANTYIKIQLFLLS